MGGVERGFPSAEFEARIARAQAMMRTAELDALVVTSPPNVRYVTGFASEFWESPTRPWFVVVPAEGQPVAVVPEIGRESFLATWLDDVRTWPAPRPEDDGVTLLAGVLQNLPRRFARIGWELGRETVLRMPITDFNRLCGLLRGIECVDGSPVLWALRMVKSRREIERHRVICGLASDAFEAMPGRLALGMTERAAANTLRLDLAERGVDAVPFVAACSGLGGYSQIIAGSREVVLGDGAVLIMDLGATWDGYFCDFDRNFAFGSATDAARHAYETVWRAVSVGIEAVRPGATAAELWGAMAAVLDLDEAGGMDVGRLGHGLGLQLTEPPSNRPDDATLLMPGMVMTIEPGLEYAPGKMLVLEENVVVTEDGCELLTRRAPEVMPVIG
ncbi:MAG: aminopeptidase P family protein [Alphaproteobacteria bacterium]|nr:aminopeptidase P family protein [Alphaproteobacteria bacterium]